MNKNNYTGTINGYTVYIRLNALGYRCGYVVLPPTHPEHGLNYNDISLEYSPHGGLTYSEQEGDEYVIGFDCAHSGDAPDLEALAAAGGDVSRIPEFMKRSGTVRSEQYVLNELEQLVAAVHNCY